MLFQMRNTRDSLLDAWTMAGRYPPQHDSWPFKRLKPIGAAAIEALVDGLPDEALERFDILPNREIDDDTRIGIRPCVSRVAALVDMAPDEAGAAFGNAVHQFQIVDEIRHPWIVEIVSNTADIQLGEMMIGWLLQGPAPSRTSEPAENNRSLTISAHDFGLFRQAIARESSQQPPVTARSCFADRRRENLATGLTRQGTQVAETSDQGVAQPEAAHPVASGRVPTLAVSLAALAVIGAATANSLPDFNRISLPDFSHISWPNFDHFSLPNFTLPNFSWPNFSWPNFDRFAAPSPHETVSVPIPDPVVTATLKDIQISQQQNAVVLASLTQSSANQQADLKRISRQISSLAAQTDSLQNAVSPMTTSSIPHLNYRARVVRRKTPATPPLPKPFGPVSVGGAPLSPAPPSTSGPG